MLFYENFPIVQRQFLALALVHVQRVAPGLVGDEHIIAFLRGDNFNVDAALKRLMQYWYQRYKLFGAEEYAFPMTINSCGKCSCALLLTNPSFIPRAQNKHMHFVNCPLSGAMRDKTRLMKEGLLTLLSVCDGVGRPIIFADKNLDSNPAIEVSCVSIEVLSLPSP